MVGSELKRIKNELNMGIKIGIKKMGREIKIVCGRAASKI